MEACVANMIEPGDKFLVGVNGYFGKRLIDMANRYGAECIAINRPWGEVFTYEEIKAAVEKHKPRVMALVHAETSTGACQPFDGVGELCRKHGVLLIADTVTSISGVPLYVDKWGIDAVYAGTQKALSCPPGVSPMSFSPAAMDKLMKRQKPVPNWYLDMKMVASYLTQTGGGARSYHHTAPIRCPALPDALGEGGGGDGRRAAGGSNGAFPCARTLRPLGAPFGALPRVSGLRSGRASAPRPLRGVVPREA